MLLSLPAGHGSALAGGLVSVASCQDYLGGVIKKHEFTRPDKESDRVRHIEALDSQTGPVFLVYRDTRLWKGSGRRRWRNPPRWISRPRTESGTRRG